MKPNTIVRSNVLSRSQSPRPSNCLQRRRHGWLGSARLALLLLAWPAVVQAQFAWTTNNGAITITGYTGLGGAVTIPASITGLPVTSIVDWAFSLCTNLTSVTIPNSVTSIGNAVFFGCSSLNAIVVGAFNPAYLSVDGVLFNKNQTTLIQYLAGKAGSQYTILNSVTRIAGRAFEGCTNLTSVTIPNSVSSIEEYVLLGCTSLTNVTIGNGVTSIWYGAFEGCISLTAITVDALNSALSDLDGVLFNKNQTTLFQYPAGKAGSQYTIPNSVTSIGGGAFSGSYLTSVTIPDSVVSIGGDAFMGCTRLTTITIPDSVTTIQPYAFIGCASLTNVTIGNSVTSIGYGAFEHCTSLVTITIPDSVITIGDWSFEYCYGLSSVTIGNSVVIIGTEAFQGCTNLSTMTIPDSVTRFEAFAFLGCTGLTNVTIGNSVTNIGYDAFGGCTSLTSVTIPKSVTTIGDWAFNDCLSLTSVYFQGNAPSLDESSVFNNATNATVFYLPGTTGWGATFGGCPTALWVLPNPLILDFGSDFGVKTNRFGFIISWAPNIPVVVEASTTLVSPNWTPVSTNTLDGGSSYFSDPQWANYPSRFYRLRSP